MRRGLHVADVPKADISSLATHVLLPAARADECDALVSRVVAGVPGLKFESRAHNATDVDAAFGAEGTVLSKSYDEVRRCSAKDTMPKWALWQDRYRAS
jgi:hypothetical protein